MLPRTNKTQQLLAAVKKKKKQHIDEIFSLFCQLRICFRQTKGDSGMTK